MPLNKQETTYYIHHRLNTAGSKEPIFEPQAIPAIFKASRGIPRLINQIADRCLLSAYTEATLKVSPQLAKKAISEAELPKRKSILAPYIGHISIIIAVILIGFLINSQAPKVANYFKEVEERAMEKEWLEIIDSVNTQDPSPTPIDTKTVNSNGEITLTPAGTILAMPSSSYTLQLAALPSKSSLKRFFAEHPNLKGKTYIYYGLSNKKPKYVVLLGTFNTYKMSKNASKEFIKRYPDISPWIKNFSAVHDDLK